MRLSPFRAGGHTTIWTRPLAAIAPPGETPGDAFYPLPLKEPAAGSLCDGSPRIATAIPPTLILIGGSRRNAQKKPNFLSSRRSGHATVGHSPATALSLEGVFDLDSFDDLAVVEVFGEQSVAAGRTCSLDDEGIPEREAVDEMQIDG